MRYSLWSHDCLVGHTELDIPCVQDHLRQGFIEPTPDGRRALIDATGVFAICGKRRGKNSQWSNEEDYLAAFALAVERRDALNLVLRDETGSTFDCAFIRVYEVADPASEEHGDASEIEDDDENDDDVDADLMAEIEEDVALMRESELYGSAWEPDDERWNTMEYFMQVALHRPRAAFERERW